MYRPFPNLGDILKKEGSSIFDYFDFDPDQPPFPTKEVAVLQGSWYEMGLQYGQQARDSLHRRVAFFLQLDRSKAETYDKLYDDMKEYIAHYQQFFPEFVELLHGMADGAKLGFLDVAATHTIYTPLSEHSCSHVSAWGKATADGGIYGGANWDYEGNLRVYEPAVIAYPDNGHAFISASGIATNAMINDAGVMVLSSGSQHKLPKDHKDIGFQYMVGFLYISAKCATAAEARDALLNANIACNIGNNVQIVDQTLDAFILEHTARMDIIRKSGDYGEQDYLIATNHFLAPEMKPSLYSGDQEWIDCQYRYDTEEQVIKENYGKVTLDTINQALGSTRTFVDGRWEDEIWSMEPTAGVSRGEWSPDNVSVTCKCVNRGLIDLKKRTLYIIAGCGNTLAAERPYAAGTASRLVLKGSPKEVLENAKMHAQVQLFLAGKDLTGQTMPDQDKIERLNKAKAALYAGHNYMNLADCSLDRNERLRLYGMAATRYSYCQCMAQQAMDDPQRIVRESFYLESWEELI
ncbi:C45 family autoproteolytic acyltransferase/hydrolase [Ihubacter massiliensis]|uniref:C45 family autoproteolytic acyltransferase/hydrolase n=1 Tax=Hominibacterium faecale TaxID=2839743 RepID=A0A9J6QXL3_9FIRM|nr:MULTISPECIES: C45 family peptidase [Eubacteriales Family XIII. Incertae Sedis]MCO7122115.1 C45 family autoproteolytic acyltransferase/hydrolase [Ihubacter massiliensis]MCU7380227.1 C45 family autoproteolytic acyltransferase/hydrolase [Hominibacterium faecale]